MEFLCTYLMNEWFCHKWHYDLVLSVGLLTIIDTLNVVVRVYASYLLR